MIGFLYRTFIRPNLRTLSHQELASRLEDYLYHLRHELGEDTFPKPAAEYLADWAAGERGWLRKYYPADSDEPHYDVTPATEKAMEWLAALEQRQFVGAESRLLTIFELLKQMVHGSETDPAARIAELEQRRAAIDAEIARVRAGELELMDPTQIKERFFQVEQTARALLSDFRQVEQNFRNLDRAVRERITTWERGKGELLAEVFGARDAITDTDQGKSFHAFWDFLMSPRRQEMLTELLERVLALVPVTELEPDRRLLRIHYDWLEAGETAQRTVARLSAQLRKYLDDQAWLENRRIMGIIRDIEQYALALCNEPPGEGLVTLDAVAPTINLVMDRPLFSPPLKPRITQQTLETGGQDVDARALFDQVYVDKTRLSARAVALRDHNSYSVVLGQFYNAGYEQRVTLAQVFWLKDGQGQPARFYVVADGALTIAEHFAGFGSDIADLKKRLRKTRGIEVHDSFPPYGAAFRRRFGIDTEQALDLFNQTVSMKSVGNLTDFVRAHMLEPFPVEQRIEALISHFDDLNRAHGAVLKAKDQIAALQPLVADANSHAEVSRHVQALRGCREALRPWFAQVKAELLEKRLAGLEQTLARLAGRSDRLAGERREQQAKRDELKQAIRDQGGDRIERIKSEIARKRVEKTESVVPPSNSRFTGKFEGDYFTGDPCFSVA